MGSIARDTCVIIPAHSWPQYLPEALASIDQQVVRPAHVITVLDAPEDLDVYARVDVPEAMRAVVIVLEENIGPSGARNIGIMEAIDQGCEWVTFLDEDDILSPQYFQRMQKSRELCPDVSIHYCDWVWFDAWNGYQRTPEYTYERLLQGPFMMSTSLINVQAWQDVAAHNGSGFDPDLRGWEDYLFFLEAGALGHSGARVGMALVKYRRHHHITISDEAHGHLPKTVEYIREKLRRLYNVELEYTWDAKKSSPPPKI